MTQTVAIAKPEPRSAVKTAMTVVIGVAFITLCAKLKVPSWPVPMTLHTFAVMALAVALGPRLATATFLAYLATGVAGLPVFSGTPERGIGLAYMAGPTGGYLLGYLAASWVTGWLAQGCGLTGKTLAMGAGLGITYAVGLPWLGLYVPAGQIVALGFAPFILGDLVNIAMVACGAALLPTAMQGMRRP